MPAGRQAAQRAAGGRDQRPLQHHLAAQLGAALPEAPGETAQQEYRQHDREPRDVAAARKLVQGVQRRLRRVVVAAQVFGQALEVAGADHGQDFPATFGADLAQAVGHELVALGDDRPVQRRAAGGEFAEAGFQEIAFFQALDFFLFHRLVGQQAGAQAGDELGAAPEAQCAEGAAEGDADVAVHQGQAQATGLGADGRGLELGARLDLQLLGQAPLVGGQGQVGGDQAGLALAQDLEQVEFRQRVGVGQGAMALHVELDRDGVVAAAGKRRFHRVDAGL